MKNLFGLACLVLAGFINCYPVNANEPRFPLVVNPYRVSEQFGCQQVYRTCVARHRSAHIERKP